MTSNLRISTTSRAQRSFKTAASEDNNFPLAAELLLGTHMTVVVRARIRITVAGQDAQFRECGLVIARQFCSGERPTRQALLAAAQRCAAQAGVAPSQVQARIEGQWVALGDGFMTGATEAPATPRASASPTFQGGNTMNTKPHSAQPSRRRHVAAAFACAGLLTMATSAASAATTGNSQAEANYRKEKAACMNGQTSQDRATCLREAGAALQEARRNGLTDPSPDVLAQNAIARCQSQPKADRADCVRLAKGEGQKEGSVAQGAIVKEIATLQIDPPAAGASSAGN